MKKFSPLLMLLCLAGFFAQAQLQIQPIIREDSTVSDEICFHDTLNWYRIITPANGMLVLYFTASVPDTGSPEEYQYLGVQVLGKNLNGAFGEVYQGGNASGDFYPYVGNSGVPLKDTSYTCCLAADTFYIRIDESLIANTCWSYTFHWHTIPTTYVHEPLPDSFPAYAQPMLYNTPVTGNLGFDAISGTTIDGTNDWLIIPPMDGTLKLNMSIEYEGGGTWVDVQPYDSHLNGITAQYPYPGPFLSPADTNLYWDCISGGDTFYIKLNLGQYGDAGYSYRMSYTMVPPVFNNDSEPNNTFAEATVVNPENPIEGHVSFYGESDDDYFKFYKPDTGFLTIYGLIESAETISPGSWQYVNLYDSTQSPIKNFYPLIGGNSVPLADTMTVASLAPGWYYLMAEHSSSCLSYRFQITTLTITGIPPVGAELPLTIFPNPSSTAFTLDFGDTRNTTISVYNAMGQLVETTLQNNERFVVLGEKLASGLYLVKATNNNGEIVSHGKLVKTN